MLTTDRLDARLRWRCRRGTRELDIMLMRYLKRRAGSWQQAERQMFERFLDQQDPDLQKWLMGAEQPADREVARLVQHIRRVNNA